MKNLRPVYRDIKDWAIFVALIHNSSIEVVEVLIGTLHYEYIDFNQHYEERRTPIIRWITRKEYEHLIANEGTVIW